MERLQINKSDIRELKRLIRELINQAKSWMPYKEKKAHNKKMAQLVDWFKSQLSEINLNKMTDEDKKLMELFISFDTDEWWLEEEEFDEDEQYNEDTAPTNHCLFCDGWQYVGNPNVLKHDSDCPVQELSSILYEIDFSRIDYRRGEVEIYK